MADVCLRGFIADKRQLLLQEFVTKISRGFEQIRLIKVRTIKVPL